MCVFVYVGGGGGGSRRYYITIRTSIMTPLLATVLRMSTARGVGGWGGGGTVVTNVFYSHNAYWFMLALYNTVN